MRLGASTRGKVFLVGAGPGDPDLITVRGARCLRSADVIVHDRLVCPELLGLAPSAELIAVGKKGGCYTFPQREINRLLVRRALRGQQVVRLKGGDPYLFGRGGEEALYLREHQIPFEVVPGVSAALAAPASAGIPVTQRGLSSTLAVIAGQQASSAARPIRWDLLAQAAETLVVLMPLGNLRSIVARLILHGRSLATPAAVIESGTWKQQRQVMSCLRDIASETERAGIQSPATLIVGEVVKMGPLLKGLGRLAVAAEEDVPAATTAAGASMKGRRLA